MVRDFLLEGLSRTSMKETAGEIVRCVEIHVSPADVNGGSRCGTAITRTRFRAT